MFFGIVTDLLDGQRGATSNATVPQRVPLRILGFVGANHVPNDGTTQRTVSTADAAPLLDRTVVAHAHVAAHVQDRVDRFLEADGTVDAGRAVDRRIHPDGRRGQGR